jgi:hypothetical protein
LVAIPALRGKNAPAIYDNTCDNFYRFHGVKCRNNKI